MENCVSDSYENKILHIRRKKLKRKIIPIFMSVIVLINIIVPVYASAADVADNNSSVYIGNGYVVYYDVKSSWGNNQNIEIKIKNICSETISNWALKYDAHGEISGLWNGIAYSSSETQYIIKNAGYNYEIQPNQEVNFGYCVTGEGLEIPKAFEICSQRTDKAENEYIVSLNVTNDWGNGFTGEIKIQNLSAEPIPRLLACLILSIYLTLTFRQMSKAFQILTPIQILSRYRLK